MNVRRTGVIAVWSICLALAALILGRARYITDLSAFLPEKPTPMQRLLVDQLREGPASRVILIALEHGEPAIRARISVAMARRLRLDREFSGIENGEPVTAERDREFLFRQRYLLSETVTGQRFSAAGLRGAIEETIAGLASPEGLMLKSLVPHDPTGEMLQIVDQMTRVARPRTRDGVWVSADGGRTLLIAQTAAAGSDTDAQELALDAIRRAFTAARRETAAPAPARVAPGADEPKRSRRVCRRGARNHTARCSAPVDRQQCAHCRAIARGLSVAPCADPGAAAGGHGCHGRHRRSRARLWRRTRRDLGLRHHLDRRIGRLLDLFFHAIAGLHPERHGAAPVAAATVAHRASRHARLGVRLRLAAALRLSGSGAAGRLFDRRLARGRGGDALRVAGTAARRYRNSRCHGLGLAARALDETRAPHEALPALWSLAIAIAATAALVLYHQRDTLWNRELSSLSPIPPADQRYDEVLRSDLGPATALDLVVVSGPSLESVLRGAERAGRALEPLIDEKVIGGFDSPASYLPSLAVQEARRASLPERSVLRENLAQATAGLALRSEQSDAVPRRRRSRRAAVR